MKKLSILLGILLMLAGCGGNTIRKKMEVIKRVGDSDPALAMRMLDSLSRVIRDHDEHTKMTYDLLDVRLQDKAYIVANSDIRIKDVVKYFALKGNVREKQEAYYYAGSVYRDLNDTPKALEYFLMSKDEAAKGDYDTLLLRNTYSQLVHLYYSVQNYNDALRYARKEEDIETLLNIETAETQMHVVNSLMQMKQYDEAIRLQDKIYGKIKADSALRDNYGVLHHILTNYCLADQPQKAKECYRLIVSNNDSIDQLALADYYAAIGEKDSAIRAYETCITETQNPYEAYDASRSVIRLLEANSAEMGYYVKRFVELCDTFDMGKRQEFAATINNQYKYYRNLEEERELREENHHYIIVAWSAFLIMLSLLISGYAIYCRRKKKQMQELLSISAELKNRNDELGRVEKELRDTEEKLNRCNTSISFLRNELENKTLQNQHLLTLTHKAELEDKAEKIMESIQLAALGKQQLTEKEWINFVAAIDKLHPELYSLLYSRFGKLKEAQRRVCYLLYAGFSNRDIENITDTPKSTLWRWISNYREQLKDVIPNRVSD